MEIVVVVVKGLYFLLKFFFALSSFLCLPSFLFFVYVKQLKLFHILIIGPQVGVGSLDQRRCTVKSILHRITATPV